VSAETFEIILQPIGRRIEMPAGATVLDAARQAGVELVALCGGEGVCGACRVRLIEGRLSDPTLTETDNLPDEDLAHGYRLGCQAQILSNVRIDIPPESLTTPQRLQLEGQDASVELAPAAIPLEVAVPAPGLDDLRSDLTRLTEAAAKLSPLTLSFSRSILADLPAKLRAHNWQVRLALRQNEVVAILPPHSPLYGLAVDVGTTKLAAYLVNLETGHTAAKLGAMNPQIAYGEDVISRITYANEHAGGALTLQSRLVETLNQLASDLCVQANAQTDNIVEAVIVGNTAMHHLFTGLPVRQLGLAPYVPAVSEAMQFPAREVGLQLAAGAYVYLPPNIAGYVGADHVAMLLGAGLVETPQTVIALDIGTNTEISLFHQGRHFSCSCASGPAFEGAHIQFGMRAAPGAIERVRINGHDVQIHTIGDQAAVGLCGSGILDVVAELLHARLIDTRGVLKGTHPRLKANGSKTEFVLVLAEKSGVERDIKVSRADINEIQLAKGAIRAGIETLLAVAGVDDQAIDQFIVAGAFGTYLDLESAIRIGLFPNLPRERYRQVGNAAGSGARQLLISTHERQLAKAIVQHVEYVELAGHLAFTSVYVKALAFPSA
jgi:uncharacterized 2Fe-2S/4Fe-4S cluster protein (DUF4445 family)